MTGPNTPPESDISQESDRGNGTNWSVGPLYLAKDFRPGGRFYRTPEQVRESIEARKKRMLEASSTQAPPTSSPAAEKP